MSDNKISEAAVDSFERAYYLAWRESTISFPQRTISYHVRQANRAALEAALPHLHPQPAAHQISEGDRRVLGELLEDLPTIGLNGWAVGVEVLVRVLDDSLDAPQTAELAEPSMNSGEMAEQRGMHDALAATLGDLSVRGWIDDVPARMIGEAARKDMAAALAANGKQQVGEVYGVDPYMCIHKFGVDGRVCLRCKWDFRANGAPPEPVGEVKDERKRFEAWATSKGLNTVRSSEEIDRYAHTDTFYAWQGYQAALAANGKQQVGEAQGDGRSIIEEFVQCAALGRPPGKMIAHAKDYLAARQPGEMIAQKVGDYRVTVAEDTITVSHGRDIVFAYSAGDAEPIMARQPGAQVPDGVWEALQRIIENSALHGPASNEDAILVARYRRDLLAAPPAQGIDRWQPIETAPTDGTRLMLWDGVSGQSVFGSWRIGSAHDHDTMTHWAPEPAMPMNVCKRDAAPGVE